jgi:hypothetical protein
LVQRVNHLSVIEQLLLFLSGFANYRWPPSLYCMLLKLNFLFQVLEKFTALSQIQL